MNTVTKNFGKLIATLSLLLGAGKAQAYSLSEECTNIGTDCHLQSVLSQSSDGVVEVLGALQFNTLYSHIQIVEITVKNLGYHKQIYLYEHNETWDFNKSITVRLHDDSLSFRADYADGAGLYLGPTEDGRDRFIVKLNSSVRSNQLPIDVYVKMGDQQFQTVLVYLEP